MKYPTAFDGRIAGDDRIHRIGRAERGEHYTICGLLNVDVVEAYPDPRDIWDSRADPRGETIRAIERPALTCLICQECHETGVPNAPDVESEPAEVEQLIMFEMTESL